MLKIDVRVHVEQFERVLRRDEDPARRRDAMAILQRWQFNEMLNDAARRKAQTLVREFGAGAGV